MSASGGSLPHRSASSPPQCGLSARSSTISSTGSVGSSRTCWPKTAAWSSTGAADADSRYLGFAPSPTDRAVLFHERPPLDSWPGLPDVRDSGLPTEGTGEVPAEEDTVDKSKCKNGKPHQFGMSGTCALCGMKKGVKK